MKLLQWNYPIDGSQSIKLKKDTIGTQNSIPDTNRVFKKKKIAATERDRQHISLDEVYQLTESKALRHVKLDKRTGRGWIYLRGKQGSVAFHFPPSDSLTIENSLTKADADLSTEFVNRMDIFGDLKSIAPKAMIGVGFLIGIRIALQGVVQVMENNHSSMRPRTAMRQRPPESVQNQWAKSRLRPLPPTINKGGVSKVVDFSDVAGLTEAKKELSEVVSFLREPQKYHNMGARIPRGALLSGPPGTGKTLLAKAVAGEADVPFFSLSGSDFMEVYVGVGASRVRELFSEARKSTTGAIMFIDEIDAIGRKRSSHMGNGGSDERESTLNQLLIEMDGFSANENVVVIAASNRCDTLDNALVRPGRFDRTIECDLPSVQDRERIVLCHLDYIRLDLSQCGAVRMFECYDGLQSNMNEEELRIRNTWCSRIAALTPGFSGADLSNVINEAAILAARHSRNGVLLTDLEESVERITFGLEKGGELPCKDRLIKTAYHEAGHAIIGWILPAAEPPIKLSIVPRKSGVLGYAQQIPNEDSLDTAEAVRDKLAVLMGGRIAEEVMFGQGSTGAEDDLQKATRLAHAYVASWGFAPDEAGLMSIYRPTYEQIRVSEQTQTKMDTAVENLLKSAQDRARKCITDNFEAFDALAKALHTQEILGYKELRETIGSEPTGKRSEAFKHYLKHDLAEKPAVILPN